MTDNNHEPCMFSPAFTITGIQQRQSQTSPKAKPGWCVFVDDGAELQPGVWISLGELQERITTRGMLADLRRNGQHTDQSQNGDAPEQQAMPEQPTMFDPNEDDGHPIAEAEAM